MITTHTQLIQALIDKYDLRSYLELGVQSTAQNFDKIRCDFKFGVDPNVIAPKIFTGTSDQYFAQKDTFQAGLKFGVCFIDGDHTKDQVKKDFDNCLKVLAPNGFIVIHDVLPDEEQYTTVPRQTKRWFGSVYQWAMSVGQYNGIEFTTYNIDCGCMVVRKNPNRISGTVASKYDWETYTTIGHALMNVTNEVII